MRWYVIFIADRKFCLRLVSPWNSCMMMMMGKLWHVKRKFVTLGNSRLTVDLTIWYQPVTVKLYISLTLILMCSATSCQCLQQTGTCWWSSLIAWKFSKVTKLLNICVNWPVSLLRWMYVCYACIVVSPKQKNWSTSWKPMHSFYWWSSTTSSVPFVLWPTSSYQVWLKCKSDSVQLR